MYIIMKKFVAHYGHLFSMFALVLVTYASSRCCVCWLHQPEEPIGAKKYRNY